MLQFTTTNVINSSKDSNTAINKYAGANGVFNVARVGSFKKDNVLSVYKTTYAASTPEQATITVPAITAGLVARLTVDVRLIDSTNSEYASAYLYFKKPVTVEVLAKSTAILTATALVKELNGLKDRYGVSYVTASNGDSDTAVITILATESHQRIKSITVEEEVASPNSLVQPEYKNVGTSFTVTVPGVQGFGDDEWMVRRIVLPTAENTRYFGINKDGRPVIGGNYSQYTLRYSIEKDGNDGIVSGGTSVTTHVFYVLSTLVTSFEAALANAGIDINTLNVTVTDVAIATASVTTAATASGVQLVATTTPSGVTGVVYALRAAGNVDASGSGADFTKVSIDGSGVLKFASGHGIVATDTIGLTVTVDGFTKAATVVMTA